MNCLVRTLCTSVAASLILMLSTCSMASVAFVAPDDSQALARLSAGVEALYDYRNYTEIKNALFEIEGQHSDIAKVYDIGNSWEKNHLLGNRDILAVKVSDNVLVDEEESEVLVVGLHHAREWTTSEVVTELVANLTDGYKNNSRISWLVDNREIWIVPIVNPDGLDYALSTDEWWRKNRRLNYDGSYGVDLNRNYEGSMNGDPAGEWGGEGSSHDPSDETYCGEAPFSEPETQAIRDLVLRHDFQLALDFHSYSELVLWPWGYTTNLTPDNDDLVRIGTEMASLNHYTPEQSVGLYPTTGDSLDWLYGGFNMFAFCFEIGTEFHPSDSNTVLSVISENLPPALLGIEIAGDKHEKAFDIVHDPQTSRNYSDLGFVVSAIITADRGVNVSSLGVEYRIDGGAWSDVQMANVDSNDSYEATIPPVSIGSMVDYYIEAQDVSGVELQSPKYAPYDLYSFVVMPAPIDYPPVIDHTPRGETPSEDMVFVSEGIEIRATAHDDRILGNVSLWYREAGTSESFTVTDMTNIFLDVYSAVIPSTYDEGAEYYIEAVDDKSQVTRVPADAPSACYLSYNNGPSFGDVALPGSPPGNVSYGQDVDVSVNVLDDFGVAEVALILRDQYMAEFDRIPLSLDAGTPSAGIWKAIFNVGPTPCVITLDIFSSDGRATTVLEGLVINVRDTTPPLLEHIHSSLLPEDNPRLSVQASDDTRIEQVQCFYALQDDANFQEITMSRVSGTDTNGLYESVMPIGSYLGELRYYFEAYDGSLITALPSNAPDSYYVSTVADPTPLEVFFNPPDIVDGSLELNIGAETRNMSSGTTLILHLMNVGTGRPSEFILSAAASSSSFCVIPPGQMLGSYVVWLVAVFDAEEIWSSAQMNLTVLDLTPPEIVFRSALQLEKSDLVVSATCFDAYEVQTVVLRYRLDSEDVVSTTSMSLVSGTATSGAWSGTIPLDGARQVEYRVIAFDGFQNASLPEGWFAFSSGESGEPIGQGTLLAILAVVVLVAIVAAYVVFNRAKRP